MSAGGLVNTLVWAILVIVIIIIIFLVAERLIAHLYILPAFGDKDAENEEKDVANQDELIVEGKETIKTNDTDIHITCTSNIPDLVSC